MSGRNEMIIWGIATVERGTVNFKVDFASGIGKKDFQDYLSEGVFLYF
jgi:hypothetical protein